ncbi:MAG: glycosyltransferase family 4 protein [Hyphomicrobiales bacterium]|nr:glycosyltransferase family 4 protein [Hyphomicrobiales bacterium]MDE2115205.1 glycosyltransferase family 4 protein [Hyphomicrobiales bacterium]
MTLKSILFAIPGDLQSLTGGYGYDRRLMEAFTDKGVHVEYIRLGDGFPLPQPQEVDEAIARILEAHTGHQSAPLLMDGLFFSALTPDRIAQLPRPCIALVHHPLGLEAGLDAGVAAHLIAQERTALALCDHIIVTSATTADTLIADFGVAPEKITVAEPGTDMAARAHGSGRADGNLRLMAAGSVVPRKGYEVLVAAMSHLRALPWHLDITGSLTRAPETAAALRAQIDALHLAERIQLCGELAPGALNAEYDKTDIFVMSSHYEGYGMVIAEAMAHGLAIVSTDGGALARTLPDGAGLKVPAGDAKGLADALGRVIEDKSLRARLGDGAFAAAQNLPRWPQIGERVLAALASVQP